MKQPDLFTHAPSPFEAELTAKRFLRLCRSDDWRIVRWQQTPNGWFVRAVRVIGYPAPANPRQQGEDHAAF